MHELDSLVICVPMNLRYSLTVIMVIIILMDEQTNAIHIILIICRTLHFQSGRSKYKTGVVSFLLCMTYHADITLTYFCIYNEFVTPILKTFVFLSRYPIYRLKPLMNNLRTLATHIDGRKWKIKIFCGRKIFMKSGPSFQHFHKKSHQKCHAILPHS